MAERTSITQICQLGIESVPGTAVAATRRLQSLSIEPSIQAETSKFRPAGGKFTTVAALNKEWTQASISGQPTYTELPYLLESVLKRVTATQPDAGGNPTVYERLYEPASYAEDTVRTYTVEQGSALRAHRLSYGLVTEIGMRFSRNGIDLSGAMLGQRLTDGVQLSTNEQQTVTISGSPTGGTFTLTYAGQTTAGIAYNANAAAVQSALEALSTIGTGNVVVTGGPGPGTPYVVEFRGPLGQADLGAMTADGASLTGGSSPSVAVSETIPGVTPASLALVPILPTQVSVYVDPTHTALGTTKLARALSADWSLGSRFGPLWTLDAAQASWAAHVETEPSCELKLLVEADAAGMAYLTNLRDSATRFLRIDAVGDTISGAYRYGLRLDLAGKVTAISDFSDQDGVYAVEYTFTAVHDATWNKALSILVRNNVASL